ncbi:phosphate system positive regulatory protein pho81 [Linderina pennispora]|nr:phosphate system positive regulatory protein pho81 [Linderina pennispora]
MECVDLLLEAAKAKQEASAEAAGDVDVQSQLAGKMGGVLLSGSPAQSQQPQADAGVAAQPKESATADAPMPMDLDLDLDGIPSLALPPPLIPFRIYGHNFLGKRTRIQIRMHTHRAAGGPPIAFSDDRDMISLKLVVIAKPDAGMVPHTVMLPLETPSTTFGFQTDDPSQFRLEFQLYPSFGLQPMGKAIALPSLFAGSSAGIARLPLLDRYLKLVAEVSFEFLAIRPFEGAQLQIGGKVETYWKSTNPAPRPNPSLTPTVGLSPRLNTITTPGATVASALIGSPHSVAESVGPGGQSDAGMSLVVSSSLAPEHVCVQVQVCMDGVPVVCPRETIQTGGDSSISVRVCDLRHTEFVRMIKQAGTKPTGDSSASAWHSYIRDAGFTLREVLEMLPIRLGLSIQVMYSTNQKPCNAISSGLRFGGCDVNDYIDSILKTVYDDSHKRARTQPPAPNASASILERVANDLYRKDTGQRNIILCSYSSQVCMALNWKQPNYAVFILTSGRHPLDPATVDAPSLNARPQHLSLKESVRFACDNNLLGIMCDAALLTRVPSLITSVKNNGLFLISFGANNGDEQMCAQQKMHGVDAIMYHGVIKYEAEHAEYAI